MKTPRTTCVRGVFHDINKHALWIYYVMDQPNRIRLRGIPSQKYSKFVAALSAVTSDHPLNPNAKLVGPENDPTGWVVINRSSYPQSANISEIVSISPGGGNKCLKMIIELANRYNIRLTLTPKPINHGTLTKPQLIQWYKRNGFIMLDNGTMMYTPTTD